MKKILSLIIIIMFSISCSEKRVHNRIAIYRKDSNNLNILMNQFANNIENIWGINEIIVTGPGDFIKYTDKCKTRSYINFNNGNVTFETIINSSPKKHLRRVIINTLLMDEDPKLINCSYEKKNSSTKKEPFLYGQILDNFGKSIRWRCRAEIFADYLIKTRLKTRITSSFKKIWFITMSLVPNHVDKRAHKYLEIVKRASKQYGIDSSLILAIIQTESDFNPFAISHADALGLMQIVRHSAGHDVFKMKGKFGQPSKIYLLDPKNNIDIGTAYLYILQNTYLSGIINPTSRHYAVITAYNSGVRNVLKIFSSDQNRAIKIINKMKPHEVYHILSTQHPSVESRLYLNKVSRLQKNYKFW